MRDNTKYDTTNFNLARSLERIKPQPVTITRIRSALNKAGYDTDKVLIERPNKHKKEVFIQHDPPDEDYAKIYYAALLAAGFIAEKVW